MSSINTNLSAITALQSLKATQNAMNKNQNQISTGLRVGEASHNASYWSISTKMKSDNGALGAVKDSIKQSKAMIDTYTSALDKSLNYLNEMKKKLTAGSNPGADVKAIQVELKAMIEGIKSATNSATFNGENWLVGPTATKKLVTSFDATAGKVSTLNVDTTDLQMFNSSTSPASGKPYNVSQINIEAATGRAAYATFSAADIDAGETITFTLSKGTQSFGTQTYTVGAETTTAAQIASKINEDSALSAIVRADVDDNGNVRLTSKVDGADFSATGGTLDAGTHTVVTYQAGTNTVAAALKTVDDAIDAVATASSQLGANKALLENQEDFIGVLSDSLTAGVSAFIDADMNEVSTRNQALQTQQQLGVQALSMANQNSQMILKLFQ